MHSRDTGGPGSRGLHRHTSSYIRGVPETPRPAPSLCDGLHAPGEGSYVTPPHTASLSQQIMALSPAEEANPVDGDMPPADPRPLGARTASFDSSLADVANLQISEGSKVRGSGSGDCGFSPRKVLPSSGILRGGHRGREAGRGVCVHSLFLP